ncbi:MAG: helix-turn-helix domain-containing protein [Pseudomonadota bacterium]
MAEEKTTPASDAPNTQNACATEVGTERTEFAPDANPASSEAKNPDSEPEYRDSPANYYDALRTAFPDERIGQVMRKVRDAKGVSIEDLHAITRHSPQKLVSIERMEVSGMSRGYITPVVRDYAKTIGLDGDTVVQDYSADCGTLETVVVAEPIPTTQGLARPTVFKPVYAAAGVCALALAGGAAFLLIGTSPAEQSTTLVTEPLNGAAQSLFADIPITERVRVENLELTLIALEDAWVEVRGPDGTLYRNRVMQAGETYIPRSGAGWTISARNGNAFEWRLGDAVVGPLGPEDAPVFAASVDTAADRARTAAPALAAAGGGQPSR